MAKNRFVNTKFWDDPYIAHLPPYEKLLFLYLLTNPLTNIAGIYEIETRRMVFDTGIEEALIVSILKNFEANKKIFYRKGWVVIVNFIKNQSLNPKVKIGIREVTKTIPKDIVRLAKIDKDILDIAYDTQSHSNSNSNLNSNSKAGTGFKNPENEKREQAQKQREAKQRLEDRERRELLNKQLKELEQKKKMIN